MPILKIREYPDKTLKKKCVPVEGPDDDVKRLIGDMMETMYYYRGVGLAANQVGRNMRVCVVAILSDDDKKSVALVNPKITRKKGSEVCEEGCLSFPGIVYDVRRAAEIYVEALNADAMSVAFWASGLFARAIQHEIDHLDGKTFFDRLPIHKRFGAYYAYRAIKKSAQRAVR
ncbi:MAG: peptide deformylase [Endomicrobiia bacterium]|nr:peptide deformylase [Endomicrobiia bacterium]